MAGVQIRDRAHAGFLHQKSTLLYGQATTSSARRTGRTNRTSRSTSTTTSRRSRGSSTGSGTTSSASGPTGRAHRDRAVPAAASGCAGLRRAGEWRNRRRDDRHRPAMEPGPLGWTADIYFGTSPKPPLLKANANASPSEVHSFTLPALTSGTTYYWKIVSKTAAQQKAEGPVYSFTTAGGIRRHPPPTPSRPCRSPVRRTTAVQRAGDDRDQRQRRGQRRHRRPRGVLFRGPRSRLRHDRALRVLVEQRPGRHLYPHRARD